MLIMTEAGVVRKRNLLDGMTSAAGFDVEGGFSIMARPA